jgi:hypothetical protein
MRACSALLVAAVVGLAASATSAVASSRNPDGYGIYTPGPRVKHGPRLWRYDPYSWYYSPRGYYPYYASGQWVPRAEMRNRYRYRYFGPRYRYYPAWGS